MAGPIIPLPSADYLRECFEYDPDTGLLRWKMRPLHHFKSSAARSDSHRCKVWNAAWAGRPAGCRRHDAYVVVRLDGALYLAHRVGWTIFYGRDPGPLIDHVDGAPQNNRLTNLRVATHSQNHFNERLSKNSTSGLKGAYWDRAQKRWYAHIWTDGKPRHIGYFATAAEAHAAWCAEAQKKRGEFFNPG